MSAGRNHARRLTGPRTIAPALRACIALLVLVGSAPARAQIQVAVGDEHRCELEAGRVRCEGWERREHCEPDRGTFDVALPEPVVAIDAGTSLACAVTSARRMFCWGWEETSVCCPETSCPAAPLTPREIAGVAGHAVGVTLAGGAVCARLDDGTVSCWGPRSFVGARIARAPAPARADDVVRVRRDDGPVLERVVDVAMTGLDAACARDDAGTVWCWGAGDGGAVPGCAEDAVCLARRVDLAADAAALRCGGAACCAIGRAREVTCWGDTSSHAIGLTTEVPAWTDLALGDGGACIITQDRVECSGMMRPGGSRGPRWDGFGVRGRSLRGLDAHLSSMCVETDEAPICWGGEWLPPRPTQRSIVPTRARAHGRLRRGERPLRTRVTPVACVEDGAHDEPPPRLDATAGAGGRVRIAIQLVANCGHAPSFDARRLVDGTIEIGIGDLPAGAPLARCDCVHRLVLRIDGVDPGEHDIVFEGHPDVRTRVRVPAR